MASRVSLQSVLIVVDGKSKLNAATFATTMLAKWDTLDNMLMQSNCCKKAKLDVTILRTADVNVDNLPSSFYDADIVIIDVTDAALWDRLAYALAIRASGGSSTILLSSTADLGRLFSAFLVGNTSYTIVQCDPGAGSARVPGGGAGGQQVHVPLADYLAESIARITTIKYAREIKGRKANIIADITATMATTSADRVQSLAGFAERIRLNEELASAEVLLVLVQAYIRLSQYVAVVKLCEEFHTAIEIDPKQDKVQQQSKVHVIHRFAEALAKKAFGSSDELHTSQQRALDMLEKIVIPSAGATRFACEANCLVGRIYKDRWKESKLLADRLSLKQAMHFYRRAFVMAQGIGRDGGSSKRHCEYCDDNDKLGDVVYPGINLATLMVASGQSLTPAEDANVKSDEVIKKVAGVFPPRRRSVTAPEYAGVPTTAAALREQAQQHTVPEEHDQDDERQDPAQATVPREQGGEIHRVLPVILHHLGLRGPVSKLTDYWQAASLFELHFLVGQYESACKAAFKMQALWSESWMIKTTYQNINIIKAVPRHDGDGAFAVMEFWFRYMDSALTAAPSAYNFKGRRSNTARSKGGSSRGGGASAKSDTASAGSDSAWWPALVGEHGLPNGRRHPCFISIKQGRLSIDNVTADFRCRDVAAHLDAEAVPLEGPRTKGWGLLRRRTVQPKRSASAPAAPSRSAYWELLATDIRMLTEKSPRQLVVGTASNEFDLLFASPGQAASFNSHILKLVDSKQSKMHRLMSERFKEEMTEAHYAAHAGRSKGRGVPRNTVQTDHVEQQASIARAKGEMVVLHELLFDKRGGEDGDWLRKRW